MKRGNKKAQFNFAWLFAVLVGGAILFLAIFGAMKTGDTSRFQSDSQIAKSISVLTDPLQAGFSEGSYGSIHFKEETRINNYCYSTEFGKNDISVSTRSDIGQEWNEAGAATSIYNKYIFSPEKSSGKDYYVLSKPFELPYKISDLIFLISENYCFMDAPEEIYNELLAFNIPLIEVINETQECTLSNTIRVCFSSERDDCDISVINTCSLNECDSVYDTGIVEKSGDDDLNYVGNLVFAAIFSDETNYDCNVQRLLYRAEKIADQLTEKIDIMTSRGCSSSLKPGLIDWSNELSNTQTEDIDSLYSHAVTLEDKNDREDLW